MNKINVSFANYCWQIIRTTDTGGVKIIYNGLTSEDNIQAELKEMGYDSSNVNVEAIDVADSVVVEDLKAETNWFDAICNFVSQIFG